MFRIQFIPAGPVAEATEVPETAWLNVPAAVYEEFGDAYPAAQRELARYPEGTRVRVHQMTDEEVAAWRALNARAKQRAIRRELRIWASELSA